MATLKDVAQKACVDVSTVSRALNNTSYVHPETKARIVAAAKELGYRPNVMAKALRQGVCLPFSSRERVIGSQIPSQSCSWVRPRSSRRCLIYSPRKTFFIETTPD
jgi:hypothetical protein